jgi:replication-associated recombination protein RarA
MYNLGIMFHGKPGTGKTTITRAIANYLGYNIELVDVSKVKTTKELKNFVRQFFHSWCIF